MFKCYLICQTISNFVFATYWASAILYLFNFNFVNLNIKNGIKFTQIFYILIMRNFIYFTLW